MATKTEITVKITNNILAKTPQDQITPEGVAEILTDIMNLIPDELTTLSGNILTLPDGQSIVIEPDTKATINSGVITFADGQTADLGSIDTDTFATILNGVITTPDGVQHPYSENDTFATFDGNTQITFEDGQVLNLSNPETTEDNVNLINIYDELSSTSTINVGNVAIITTPSILSQLPNVTGIAVVEFQSNFDLGTRFLMTDTNGNFGYFTINSLAGVLFGTSSYYNFDGFENEDGTSKNTNTPALDISWNTVRIQVDIPQTQEEFNSAIISLSQNQVGNDTIQSIWGERLSYRVEYDMSLFDSTVFIGALNNVVIFGIDQWNNGTITPPLNSGDNLVIHGIKVLCNVTNPTPPIGGYYTSDRNLGVIIGTSGNNDPSSESISYDINISQNGNTVILNSNVGGVTIGGIPAVRITDGDSTGSVPLTDLEGNFILEVEYSIINNADI